MMKSTMKTKDTGVIIPLLIVMIVFDNGNDDDDFADVETTMMIPGGVKVMRRLAIKAKLRMTLDIVCDDGGMR